MLKGFTRKFKPLEILTEEQLQAIHRGTLDILETTGVRVEHDRALDLFGDHGCKIDLSKKRVRIPGYLVESCLQKCPSSFSVRARNPKYDLRIGGNTLYFVNSVGMRYLDLNTWESRPGTLQEHAESIQVLDSLDTVHMLVGWEFYMDMKGVSPFMMPLQGLSSAIRNSTKAQDMGYACDCELFAIKMAKTVGVDLLGHMSISPPLTLFTDCCEAGFRFIEAGFPVRISSGIAYGGSSPATIAGSTVTFNAEVLAGLVLAQLINPGVGIVISDSSGFPMDMKSGHLAFGDVAVSLHNIVFEQIWHRYGIPTASGGSGFSSSKKIDFQAGYERAMNALICALAGTNLPWLHGAVYAELTYNPVMSILDDDIAGWIGRFIEGIDVNDETLAIDLIENVGPIPGQYLNTEHTRKWWRKEQFIPKSADRLPYPEWIKQGKKDAIILAKERVAEILQKHTPDPLTPQLDKDIDGILEEATSYYRQKGSI